MKCWALFCSKSKLMRCSGLILRFFLRTISNVFPPSRRMYEIAPDEWCTFSFTHKDVENKTEKFVAFAIRFVRMLDMSIDLLGPDMDIMAEQLSDLGVAHKHFGVSQRHYDLMGKALIYGLGVILCKNTFTDSRKDAWETVFKFMSTAMVNGAESA